MGKYTAQKKAVLEAAQEMLATGLVIGTSGNISLRLAGRRPRLAITPSSRHYDLLTADDIQILDFDGRHIEGSLAPSVETNLHIGIYKARKDINAIIHTHSVYASAAAAAGRDIPPILEDQVACLGGEIKLAAYAPSGSPELVTGAIKALGDRSGALLANHGALGTGRNMRDAFTASEMIEKTAKIYLLAQLMGNVNPLPKKAIATLKAVYDKVQNGG